MKPTILIGNGCRNNPELIDKLCSLGVPILTTWQGIDLVPEDSPVFCGRPGVIGQRAANIIVQSCNRLYTFGAKLDAETVGWNFRNFAPRARKVVIDCDQAELDKLPTDWEKICQDLTRGMFSVDIHSDPEWLDWCKALYARFRPELDGCARPVGDFIDPYYFVRVLSDLLPDGAIIVPGSSGMQSCAMMQAFKIKRGQRILLCNTIGSMGMEPMAIGAAIASGKPVTVVTGDGGFSLNIQELEVVRRENLPIKYFVFSNGGYGSVVNMQDNRFGLRVGADPSSGFTTPNWGRVAYGFGLPFFELQCGAELLPSMASILSMPGAALIEVKSSLEFHYAVKMSSSLIDNHFILDSLEDMSPKIDDLLAIMEWGEL